MKKIALISISIMMVAGIWISTAPDNEVYAISGCCKQRSSADKPWYKSGSDLQVCKDLNVPEEDNIFHEAGQVWWDVAC